MQCGMGLQDARESAGCACAVYERDGTAGACLVVHVPHVPLLIHAAAPAYRCPFPHARRSCRPSLAAGWDGTSYHLLAALFHTHANRAEGRACHIFSPALPRCGYPRCRLGTEYLRDDFYRAACIWVSLTFMCFVPSTRAGAGLQ